MFALIIADSHVGSAFGPFPDGHTLSSGAKVLLNDGQKYLNSILRHALSVLPQNLDLLVFNGDVIDGNNPAERARYLTEQDPMAQAAAAAELFRPFVDRARRVVVIGGSKYHVGRGYEYEEHFAALVGADVLDDAGHRVVPWAVLEVGGALLDIAHHQSFTSRYRATPMEREIGFALERAARRGEAPPNVIIRSHTHTGFRVFDDGRVISISTPPLKLQDWFAASSRMPNRLTPDNLGMIGVRVLGEPSPYGMGDGRIVIARYLYEHPETRPIVHDGAASQADSRAS